MNFRDVAKKLTHLEAAKGNEKLALLEDYLQDDDFVSVAKLTLNTALTYKMSKVKRIANADVYMSNNQFVSLLVSLTKMSGLKKADKELVATAASANDWRFDITNRILKRNLGCGVSIKTIRKINKSIVPYFPYMRCSGLDKLDRVNLEGGAYSQLKANGCYTDIEFFDNNVTFTTRNGEVINLPTVISPRLATGFSLSGEITGVYSDGRIMDRAISNGLVTKAIRGSITLAEADCLRFSVWDMVGIRSKYDGINVIPYDIRFKNLWDVIDHSATGKIAVIETRKVFSEDQLWSHYDDVRRRGLEGTVVKDGNAIWKDGTSPQQIKIKAEKEVELKCIGFKNGDSRSKWKDDIGSLICVSSCGELVTDVGMGLSDEDRLNPLKFVDQILTVKFNEITKAKNKDTWAMSHARLTKDCVRFDKSEADDLDYIKKVKSVKRKK